MCIGVNNGTAQSLLKQEYKDDISIEEAVGLAVRVMSKTMDSTTLGSEKRELLVALVVFLVEPDDVCSRVCSSDTKQEHGAAKCKDLQASRSGHAFSAWHMGADSVQGLCSSPCISQLAWNLGLMTTLGLQIDEGCTCLPIMTPTLLTHLHAGVPACHILG